MMESEGSTHSPADAPPAGRARAGRTLSPWELDPEWQEAAPQAVFRLPRKASPRPGASRGTDAASSPAPTRSAVPPTPPQTPSAGEESLPIADTPQRIQAGERAPEGYVPHVRRHRSGKASRAIWPALMVLSMGMLLFVFVAWQYLKDDPRGSDDDLRPAQSLDQTPVIHCPSKIRRFLNALVPLPSGTMPSTPPWMWDTPTLSRFFKSNGAALDNLRDLLEDADWHPAHAAWHAKDLGAEERWTVAFILKQAESAYLARLGQEEAAFTAAIDLAELSWRLEQIWAWPSFYSRALEGHERSAQSIAELLKKTRLPEETLRQFQRQFSICQSLTDTLVQALNAFYLHEKKLILGPASGEPLDTMPGGAQLKRPGRLFFKPDATLNLFIDHFRRLKNEARAPLANTGLISINDSAALHQQGYQPNSAGEAYCASRMASYLALPARLGLARARAGLVLTLFAVRRCIAEQRTLPPTLDSLRPKYLLDVPVDPFSTAPLLYDMRHGWIWSVGTDLRSRGGAPTVPAMHDPAEPTVEIGIGLAAAVQ